VKLSVLNQSLLKLGIIGLFMIVAAYFQQYCSNWLDITEHTQSWISNSLLNLGSGLIGSVIVIFLYNRLQEKINEYERQKRQNIALLELGGALKSHNAYLMSLFAATSSALPSQPFSSAQEALSDEGLIANIEYLDIYKPSYDSSLLNIPWYKSLHDNCKSLVQAIKEVQFKYSPDLDTQLITLLSNIINDNLIEMSESLPYVVDFNKSYLTTIGHPIYHRVLSITIVHDHYIYIADLIRCYNAKVNEKDKVPYYASHWTNPFFPIGCGREDTQHFSPLL